jgi:hypothetical protein
VVRELQHDVQVVALLPDLVRVDEVEPAEVRAGRVGVEDETGLGID